MATTASCLRIIEHAPFHADPILAAIDAHDEAWSVWQVAPDATLARRSRRDGSGPGASWGRPA